MVDSAGFAEITTTTPTLYHLVPNATDTTLRSILTNGLERTTTRYEGFWESRARHVYMGGFKYIREMFKGHATWDLLGIDTTKLEPQRINPDEDHFMTQGFSPKAKYANYVGDKQACQFFHRPFPPTSWIYDWGKYLKFPVPSLGEWADSVGLGDDPREALYSSRKGSIAYDGVVPAGAIRLVKTTRTETFWPYVARETPESQ